MVLFRDGFFRRPAPGQRDGDGNPGRPCSACSTSASSALGPAARRALELMVAAVRRDFDAISPTLYARATDTWVDIQVFPQRRGDARAEVRRAQARGHPGVGDRAFDLIWGAVKRGIDSRPHGLRDDGPRARLTLEGTGAYPDHPELDPPPEARPHFLRLIAQRSRPTASRATCSHGLQALDARRADARPGERRYRRFAQGHLTLKGQRRSSTTCTTASAAAIHSALTIVGDGARRVGDPRARPRVH